MTILKDKIIEKVEKLFRLSENNSSEAESKAAILKARRLMAEHNIDIAELHTEEEPEEIIESENNNDSRVIWWHVRLSAIIAPAFRCRSTTALRRKKYQTRRVRVTSFIGYESDVKIAESVFQYAKSCVEHFSDEYYQKYNNGKNEYIQGFLSGISEALEKQDLELSEETALVLVVPVEVTNAMEERTSGRKHKHRAPSLEDMLAMSKGYEDGLRFDHDRKMVQTV